MKKPIPNNAYWQDEINSIWEQIHQPDIKQVQNWKSWENK